jgi:signal transduction histidine kinase
MRLRVPAQPTDAVVDAAAAGGLLVLGLLEATLRPAPLSRLGLAGLAVLWSVPLAWRRRFPIPVLAIVVLVGPIIIKATPQGGVISYVLAGILASFTVGRHLDPPATWWGPVLSVGFPWAATALVGGVLSDYFFFALLYGSPWRVGFILRQRERRITELAGEATQLREQQAERERRAIANERARIARELHDIISHSISVITIQTQAIRRRLGPDHATEADDLQAVEATARQAMAEMRRLLGVLRADDDPVALTPQPGLDQLPQLITDTQAAGVPVQLHVEGNPTPLPPGVDLTAFRILQEALTNVRKHAPGARATVLVHYTSTSLELQVDNNRAAPSKPDTNTNGVGQGLVGMRERVTLYGGTLEVGRRPDRFTVAASLPLTGPTMP